MIEERGRRGFLPALLISVAFPVLVFYWILARQFTALPFQDDYHALLDFAIRLRSLPTVSQRLIWIVVAQHNEYKLITQHLLVAVQLWLLGHVDLGLIVWIGNLLLLPVFWLIWRDTLPGEGLRIRLMLLLPVVWLLFSLGYADTLDWAVSGTQEVAVVAFGLACVHCLTRERAPADVLACGFYLLACLTYANAFLLGPIGFLVLLRPGRRVALLLWVLASAAAAGLYAYGYTFLPHLRATPLQAVLFFFSMLGSSFENARSWPVPYGSTVAGLVVAALLVTVWIRKVHRRNLFAFYSVVWLCLTCMLTTYGRASLGRGGALAPRYKLYSNVILVLLYLLLVELVRQSPRLYRWRRPLLAGTVLGVALFGLAQDGLGWKLLQRRRSMTMSGMDAYRRSGGQASPFNPVTVGFPGYETEKRAERDTLTEALHSGVWRMPAP